MTAFCAVLGWGWLGQEPSDQELLANFSKALDYLTGAMGVRGWPWWTPNFLGGHSLAPALATIFSSASLLLGGVFSPTHGPKIIGLLYLAASALAMFAFAKKLTRSDWTALAAALLYLTCPQAALRLAGNEHMVVAMCFPYPPLICLALLDVAERGSWRSALGLAMALSAMLLTFAKIAVVFLPGALGFALWLYVSRSEWRKNLRAGAWRAAIGVAVLGVLPLLPAMRETRWMALFTDDPIEGWQRAFSMKAALSWADRGGLLMEGMPPHFTVDQGGFYLGAVTLAALAAVFLRGGQCVGLLRVFVALGLVLRWLAGGPWTVLGGHLEYLRSAQGAWDWAVPLAWLGLVAEAWVIWKMWGGGAASRWRWAGAVATLAGFWFLPGFRFLAVLPGFGEIRAPWSFWQVGGSFCLAMAGALALAEAARRLQGRRWSTRALTAAAVVAVALGMVDLSVYHRRFFTGGLPSGTFNDFRAVQTFLGKSERSGSVYPLSGRYFYMMTPFLSRRPIVTEAFNSYYMEQWTRTLQTAALGDDTLLRIYLDVAGVAFLLIDKQDPDTPKGAQEHLRGIFPTALENEHFLVLENPTGLAPAFLAREFIPMPPESWRTPGEALAFARFDFLPVEAPGTGGAEQAGVFGEHGVELRPMFRDKAGTKFQSVPLAKRGSFHKIDVPEIEQSGGWLVVGEAWHPDWCATASGREVPVRRALGGLIAVPLPDRAGPVRLTFSPPWWYGASATTALAGWVAGGVALMLVRGKKA